MECYERWRQQHEDMALARLSLCKQEQRSDAIKQIRNKYGEEFCDAVLRRFVP